MRSYLFVCLLLSTLAFSQPQKTGIDPTVALENFNFSAIDYTSLDTASREYIQGIEAALYHRYDKAEQLLKHVALRTDWPLSAAAKSYLWYDLYFWRGRYVDCVHFSDQMNDRTAIYAQAKVLAKLPPFTVLFPADEASIPISIKRHSYAVVSVLLNGTRARLILDTGANRTMLSKKLYDRLGLNNIASDTITNALGNDFSTPIAILDSASLGTIRLNNVPVWHSGNSKLFKILGVDGLLGWDVLSSLCYTTDFKKSTLVIRKPALDSTLTKNLFGIGQPLMVIQATNGNQLNMFFDSGSNRVDITATGAAKIRDYSVLKRLGLVTSIGNTKTGFLRYMRQFSFISAGTLFRQKRTYMTPVERFMLNIKADGVLCNKPFQQGRLTIDYLNNHFSYTP